MKPHKAATSSTVWWWLKEGCFVNGTDTRMFKSNLARAASTTKFDVTGVSVCDIMKQGQWYNKSTFQSFYTKEIIDHFQGSILSNIFWHVVTAMT